MLIAAKLDRALRSVRDFAGLLDRAQSRGWRLVLLALGDTSTAAGEMTANLIASAAQYERRLIGHSGGHARAGYSEPVLLAVTYIVSLSSQALVSSRMNCSPSVLVMGCLQDHDAGNGRASEPTPRLYRSSDPWAPATSAVQQRAKQSAAGAWSSTVRGIWGGARGGTASPSGSMATGGGAANGAEDTAQDRHDVSRFSSLHVRAAECHRGPYSI